MVHYVLFDFDGTLADSKDVFMAAWNQLAKTGHIQKIDQQEFEELRKHSIRERGRRLNIPLIKMPMILSKLYRSYRHFSREIKLFHGVKDLLDDLESHGYQTAIISSNSEDVIQDVLHRNEITNVSQILCSRRIFGKDRLIRQFLRQHQLQNAEVVYVGDEQRDVLAAKTAGIKIIGVSWGYDTKELLQSAQPDYMAQSPQEILEVVNQNWALR
ncbi:HAD-IA family hydrolase [Bacillus sp. B15-48]|uniref:HAD-IA family hydrolase n=1 Tax=Bacillus sp. B15-48 TaxID=1548601 RepID=UPI00193F7A7F|nr:HAD-IA family hydrolase [Bacillus sp. B15-48]MBM4761743.1 HAD-IA family hydrolase [Bacillus sp. B15-48]